MPKDKIENFLGHLVLLIKHTMDELNPLGETTDDFESGRTLAYYEVASYVEECSRIFNVRLTSLGINKFDAGRLIRGNEVALERLTVKDLPSPNFKSTVTNLMDIFRSALVALVPTMERAMIPWKDAEAYDDWENIAKALFKNIVCASLYAEVQDTYPIADYDLERKDYVDVDYIIIRTASESHRTLAFVGFLAAEGSFDSVRADVLDYEERVFDRIVIPHSQAEYVFNRKAK